VGPKNKIDKAGALAWGRRFFADGRLMKTQARKGRGCFSTGQAVVGFSFDETSEGISRVFFSDPWAVQEGKFSVSS